MRHFIEVLRAGELPDVSRITYNTAQTGLLLGSGRMLGTLASSGVPRRGFDQAMVVLPRVGEAALLGNVLRTQGLQSENRHRMGFQMGSDVTFTLPFTDGKHTLPWSLKATWERSMGPIGLDALNRMVIANAVANTEEMEFVDAAWGLGKWTTEYAAGTVAKWNSTTSDPVAQVNTARQAVLKASGIRPNVMTLPRTVCDALLVHPRILSRIPGGAGSVQTQPQKVTLAALAALFEMDEIIVAERVRNVASDLLEASKSLEFTITNGVLIYARGANGMPIVGDGIVRAGWRALGNSDEGVAIDTGTNAEERYDWWNALRCAAYKVINPGAGAFWEEVV